MIRCRVEPAVGAAKNLEQVQKAVSSESKVEFQVAAAGGHINRRITNY